MIEENNPITKEQNTDFNYGCLTVQDKTYLRQEQAEKKTCYKSIQVCYGNCCRVSYIPCAPYGCGCMRTVQEGFEALVIENGRYSRKVGPGLHQLNPCTEEFM